MVNPGAFRGSRKDFLTGEKAAYAAAVHGGYAADAIAKIQRRYLKRYPIDLPHDQEPTPEWLAAVDDDAPEPEPKEPVKDEMSELEYKVARRNLEDRKNALQFRKAQIKRWMVGQYAKDSSAPPKGVRNPYTSLLQKLIGSNIERPRQKSATNLWRKPDAQREKIEAHLQGEIILNEKLGTPVSKRDYAKIRDQIARELFGELDAETRRHWQEKAKEQHKEDLQEYSRKINAEPSTDPGDRQLAIQGLVQFMQPMLDRVAASTGWKLSLLAGGPEPASDGHLSMISIHSGYTTGDIPMTFGRAERVRYKKHIVPIFGSFLRLCYSPEECQSRALRNKDDHVPMSAEADTDESTYHSLGMLNATNTHVKTTNAQTPTVAPSPAVLPPESPATVPVITSATISPTAVVVQSNASTKSTPREQESDSHAVSVNAPEALATKDSDRALSPTSSIDNPFPFEDFDDLVNADSVDRIPVLSVPASPLATPLATPPRSRITSPAPVTETETISEVTSGPLEVDEGDITCSPQVSAVAVADDAIDAIQPDITQQKSKSSGETAKKTLRKRKVKETVDPAVVEPTNRSKRTRTKSTRAIEAEEQQRPKRVTKSDSIGGKENGGQRRVRGAKGAGRGRRG